MTNLVKFNIFLAGFSIIFYAQTGNRASLFWGLYSALIAVLCYEQKIKKDKDNG